MSYYLENLKEYPLLNKSNKQLYIKYPFTLDTETSHTPLNRPNDNDANDDENPFLSALVDLSPILDNTSIYIPAYIAQDCDIAFIKRVCRRHKIKIEKSGATIAEVYENVAYMWGGMAINEADQANEIFEHLATKKDKAIREIDEPITKGVFAWVYQWAFCFRAGKYFSDAIGGRTARHLAELLHDIDEYLEKYSAELSENALHEYYKNVKPHSRYSFENPSKSALKECRRTVSCVVFCHNLGYDYEYLYPFLCEHFDDIDEFFMRPHTPLIARLSRHIELRDSVLYFNDNLARLTNAFNVDHKKRVGLVDYDEIHYPDSRLSADDWEYQFYDVLGLQECIMKDFEQDGYDVTTAPLTSTGKIRRECRARYLADPDNRKLFTNCFTNGFVHLILRHCFMGGYTHGNRNYKGELIEHLTGHRDMRSFYPTELRKTENIFQAGQFIEIESPTLDMLTNPEPKTISMGIFTFKNARLKKPDDGFPFMSTGRVLTGKHGTIKYTSDNGRALRVDGVFSLYLTDVDFMILYDQYVFDEINVDLLFTAPADVLPSWITDFIDDKFIDKTRLKNISKKLESENAPIDVQIEADTNLQKGKDRFNGIYGMFVTDPAKPDIVRGPDGDFVANDVDLDKKMADHYGYYRGRFNKSSKGFLPYSVGVWCTAYARRDFHYFLKIADNAKTADGRGSGVYADTDSIFYIQSDAMENIYNDMNEQMLQKAIDGGYYIQVDGKIINYDVFESEKTANKFKFLHSKCYAMEIDGRLSATVAGVPERKMIDVRDGEPIYIHRADELGSIDRFNDGFTFHQCGGTSARYIHRPIQIIEYNGHYVECADACIIIPTTKKLKDFDTITKVAQENVLKFGRGELL